MPSTSVPIMSMISISTRTNTTSTNSTQCRQGRLLLSRLDAKRNLKGEVWPNTPTISRLSIPFQLESLRLPIKTKIAPHFLWLPLPVWRPKAYWLVGASSGLRQKELPELSLTSAEKVEKKERGALSDWWIGAVDYIHLKGHANLEEIYKNYEVYLSAPTSEGWGWPWWRRSVLVFRISVLTFFAATRPFVTGCKMAISLEAAHENKGFIPTVTSSR